MSNQQDELIRAYLEQVVRIQQEESSALTQSDLEGVARELGLTDADVKRLRQRYREYVKRAEGLMDFGNQDEAIAQLRQAVALAPMRHEALSLLAHAHEQRYVVGGEKEDRAAALEMATRALQLEPSDPSSLRVLSVLAMEAKVGGGGIGRKGAMILAAFVVLVMVGTTVMVICEFIFGP